MELRPVVEDADVDAYLDVRNRIEPADPVDRPGFEAARHRPDRIDLLALSDGLPVGMGFVRRSLEDPESAHAFGKVGVLRDHRRRGVGTHVFRALSEHARSFGRRALVIEIREDDEPSLDYLSKRGFETVLRAQEIALDVSSANVVVEVPPGVTLVTLSDDALDELVHDAEVEIARDLPAIGVVVTRPFEEWRAALLGHGLLRSCSFAATSDGGVVGVGFLNTRPGGGAVHGLTGVRRAWRGRGIARAIKCAQIQAARAAGIAELRTSNEVGNAPIRGLNESLGYRPLATSGGWLQLRGPFILGG